MGQESTKLDDSDSTETCASTPIQSEDATSGASVPDSSSKKVDEQVDEQGSDAGHLEQGLLDGLSWDALKDVKWDPKDWAEWAPTALIDWFVREENGPEQADTTEQADATGIIDVKLIKQRSGNALRTASRYHMGRDLAEDYEVDDKHVLGRGMTGAVVAAYGRTDTTRSRQYAVKSFQKKTGTQANENSYEMLRSEAEVYLTLDHPNIVRLHDVYEDDEKIHLVQECCTGGELFDRLKSQRSRFSEYQAAEATQQVLLAVSYLHTQNVVHRDLKLENFLYESSEPGALLKLIDFGFAKFWDPNSSERMQAKCGSLSYISPDVLSRAGYTSKCDCWSIGVIAFMLIAGYPPFHGQGVECVKAIRRGTPDWRESRWSKISCLGRDFVNCLLQKDPQARMTTRQALQHPWIINFADGLEAVEGHPFSPRLSKPALRSLQMYSQSSRLKRVALQLVAQELPQDTTDELRKAFLALDLEKEGSIRPGNLKSAIRRPPQQYESNSLMGERQVLRKNFGRRRSEPLIADGGWTAESKPALDTGKSTSGARVRSKSASGMPNCENTSRSSALTVPGIGRRRMPSKEFTFAETTDGIDFPDTDPSQTQHASDEFGDDTHGSGSSQDAVVDEPMSPLFSSPKSTRNSGGFTPKTPASMLRKSSEETVASLCGAMDTNKDGHIYYTDFVAATTALGVASDVEDYTYEQAILSAFRRFDYDKSGYICKDDLRSVLGGTCAESELEEILGEVVTWHSGSINYEQFAEIIRGK